MSDPPVGDRPGPLAGLRVLEMSAIGPVPFAATWLADMGATVLRIEPPGPQFGIVDARRAIHLRGRDSLKLDLKTDAGRQRLLEAAESADVVLEGSRPGTLERLGLSPELLLARNPTLVIGRMTGWGQDGPRAATAGHDITYIALAGPLRHTCRDGDIPVPPLNLVGDYGGGAMFLIAGVLAAVHAASASGRGQVVDAAMVDGAAYLMSLIYSLSAQGLWPNPPGRNLLDSGAPFYDVYRTADGGFVAVGALEPHFYIELLHGLGLDQEELPQQYDTAGWPRLRQVFAARFAEHPREHWTEVFDGTDACVTPVLDMVEAAGDPHIAARGSIAVLDGVLQPTTAPRFSATPGQPGSMAGRRTGEAAWRAWQTSAHDRS